MAMLVAATEGLAVPEKLGRPGYVCGCITALEALKDKLKVITVDVGAEELKIVTNAPNVTVGARVVVATVGTVLNDDITVAKRAVGGTMSEGILCDCPMLGWTGGGAGTAALLTENFAPGDEPPASRPRPAGADSAGAAAAVTGPVRGPGEESLFEKKMTKEEKKAAAKAKADAKKAAKAAAASS